MRNKKTYICFIILLIGVVLLFCNGCKDWKGWGMVIQLLPPEPEGETEQVVTGYNEAIEASKDPNTLIILVTNGVEAKAAREISSEFEANYSMKTLIIEDDFFKLRDLMNIAAYKAGHSGIVDIMFFPEYIIGENPSRYQSLNALIQEDKIDTSDFFIDIFNSAAMWGEDQILGVPVSYSISTVVYRTDIFFNLGITPDGKWSYGQYYEIMDKVNKGVSMENTILFDPSELDIYWSNRYWSLGGLCLSKKWDVTLDNENAYEAVEMLKVMQNYASEILMDKSSEEIATDFIDGKSAVFEGSPDFLFERHEEIRKSNVNGTINVYPVPGDNAGNFSQLNSLLVGISAYSSKKSMAWEWIKLFSSEEKSKLFLDMYGLLPVRISTYEDESLNSKYELLSNVYEILKRTDVKTLPKISASHDLWKKTLNNSLKKALIEEKSPKDTIEEIEKKWQETMRLKPPYEEFLDKEI